MMQVIVPIDRSTIKAGTDDNGKRTGVVLFKYVNITIRCSDCKAPFPLDMIHKEMLVKEEGELPQEVTQCPNCRVEIDIAYEAMTRDLLRESLDAPNPS